MAFIPYAPELGAAYTLTGPDGSVAVLNDKTSADYVGTVSEITGLDSPEVREAGDVLVSQDGGWHGNFWYGRRPITISGLIYGHADIATRNLRMSKLMQATNAMIADGTITFLGNAAGAISMYTTYRRQQPLRFTGGWNKEFQVALVSQFAPVFSAAVTTANPGTTGVTVENRGNYPSYPTITLTGAAASPITVTNTTTGTVIKFLAGFSLSAGQVLIIDTLNHTARFNSTTYANDQIDFNNSAWVTLVKGNNTVTTSGGTIRLDYRDAWV